MDVTTLPSPIEPKGRLRHLCFTPKVPRLLSQDQPGTSSNRKQLDLQQLHDIDPDLLSILHDTNNAADVDVDVDVVEAAAGSAKNSAVLKRTGRKTKKSKPDFEVESFLPESEVVFQLEKMSGLKVTKDVVPALMETIKKFNILTLRLVLSDRHHRAYL